jgi:hydroxyacylglutathione hydrolase
MCTEEHGGKKFMKAAHRGIIEKRGDSLYVLRFPELFNANCILYLTSRFAFVVDTYMGPDSMQEFRHILDGLVEKRDLFIINTHSHFDHIWGNCAFPDGIIIAHQSCLEIMRSDAKGVLEATRKSNPEWIMGNVELLFPHITLAEKLVFHDGPATLEIRHIPGHSRDSIALLISPEGLCLAGDTLEDPFPLLSESSSEANIDIYIDELERLCLWGPSCIIPGHGDNFDAALLTENLLYLRNLKTAVHDMLQAGREPHADELPIELCLGKSAALNEFYIKAHKENIEHAVFNLRRIQ